MVGEGPATDAVVVAPFLGAFAVEEQVVVGIEQAVAVTVAYLDGQLAQAVEGGLAGGGGEHAGPHAVDGKAVDAGTRQRRDIAGGDAVDARSRGGEFPPASRGEHRLPLGNRPRPTAHQHYYVYYYLLHHFPINSHHSHFSHQFYH